MADDDRDDKAQAPSQVRAEPHGLEAENASLRDRLLRALADAENTRRRAERSAADARQFAISHFASELLTSIDNLRRALLSAESLPEQGPADTALLDGVRATERLLTSTLERFGVRHSEAAAGTPFDPSRHEAVTEVEDDAVEPGTVVRVLEEGYTIHDRLLRPARVIVARKRQKSDAAASNERQHSSNTIG
ncbi:nucleotide exchange factor GrpE [Bradyrhizobium sp.]|uniref:nucleotide exchange factor GrpE n=1 Tax=Bradyrhizobium sp. TaxID=376 RepID=UPI0025C68870|nr:nucleotide exchange factor GrpE [Bradyrhizobium sp.]